MELTDVYFSHLHVHSTYSVLDGMAKIEELILRAKEMGQSAIAITDHGSTSGLWQAQQLGKKHGIKVILGSEFYYERSIDEKNGHIVVIAENDKGLENLFRLQEFAFVDNFYRRPRISLEKLFELKEGLIVTTACLGNDLPQYLLNDDKNGASEWLLRLVKELGDSLYLEIQPNSIPEQWDVNNEILKLGKELNIKVIATNDVHYCLKEDHFPHEVLLALQVKKKMDDEKRFRFTTQDFWLKSKEEMFETFIQIDKQSILTSLNNTQEIVDRCNAEIRVKNYLPRYYDLKENESPRERLVNNITKGAIDKGVIKNNDYMKQVQYEIDVIDGEGYSDYFLIVQDYITSARERGETVGDGRGSCAGSKVSYLTDITRLEPSKHNLLFERFLSPGRTPDVDIDFSNQESVFKDLQNKYGEDSVARIVAFGTMTPRSVCRKVFSTFNHPMPLINQVSKSIRDLCPDMQTAYKDNPQLIQFKKDYPLEFSVIERLEGGISHETQHAGGVIIYPNLSRYLPIKTVGEDRDKRIVAFDMDMIADIGFHKFDILGLETIEIVKNTLDLIEKEEGTRLDLYDIDYDDEEVYKMLSTGDVSGIFQISAQASKVMEQQPKNFKDLIAINAVIRPGTCDFEEYIGRRNGGEWNVHPDRMPYMEETSGLMIYQEQFLLDARTFAGWDIAYADKNIRKNKKILDDVPLKVKFIDDSMKRGYSKEDAEQVWAEILISAGGGYNFNKAHSACYAMTSFQTAYLKYYYPKHFYASLMSYEATTSEGQTSLNGYIAELKGRGINILPPDINNSTDDFVVTNEGIMYKITAITHVGDSAIQGINDIKPISSLQDLIERREKSKINKRVIQNLIKAGCLDFENTNRAELLWEFDMTQRTKTQIKNEVQLPKYEWNDKVKCAWEKEALGLYLSVHPMEKYGFRNLETFNNNTTALQGGEVAEVSEIYDKNGKKMAFVMLNTLFGVVKTVVFSSLWDKEETKDLFKKDNLVLVKGNRSGDSILFNQGELLI